MSEVSLSKIESMIYLIRGKKVMLDKDLAELYGVETKYLNKAVKRNLSRFPEDFMFQLDFSDLRNLRFQFGTLDPVSHRNYNPFAFTENGVAMLSGILHSEKAISVNIHIMRTFTKLRSIVLADKNFAEKLREIEHHSNKVFGIVFERLDSIDHEISELKTERPSLSPKRKKIGLK